MNTTHLIRFLFLLVVTPLALVAQMGVQQDSVPLKHWSAPLYWQRAQAVKEEHAAAAVSSGANSFTLLVYVAMVPCRVVDTRVGQGFPGAFGPPALIGGASRTFPIPSSNRCAIPADASAYSFNITVVPPGPLGFITAYQT